MDKAVLLRGFLPERAVELPSGQGSVTVRGLSRNEAVAVQKYAEDVGELEVQAITRGLLDPKLTEDEARTWRDVTVAADVQAVMEAISELSSMDANAGKGPTSRSRRSRT
jgi:hypothetical protein